MIGYKKEDFGIIKNTPISEKVDLQLFGVTTTTLATARNPRITVRVRY